jgi:hypothetical protein
MARTHREQAVVSRPEARKNMRLMVILGGRFPFELFRLPLGKAHLTFGSTSHERSKTP